MSKSIAEIRTNCIKARALMERSRKAKKSPVLVEVSKSEVEALGLENVRDLVDNYKEEYGLEMYINLDHSPSVEDAIAGIEAGFEFIHIDI